MARPVLLLVLQRRFPQFGQFLAGNRLAKGKATKQSSAWTGRHKEVLKAPLLQCVVVILGLGLATSWPHYHLTCSPPSQTRNPGLYGLAHHEQAPLAAVIPHALGYTFLVGHAGWQAWK